MIGVISKSSEKSTVEEFFQLFKTPWKFYDKNEKYDVILMTTDCAPIPKAKLVILFNTMTTHFDDRYEIKVGPHSDQSMIQLDEESFPVQHIITFPDSDHHSMLMNKENVTVGLRVVNPEMQILRIGYDLFDEIEHLLTEGQRSEHAFSPTLDIHIELLKKWILDAGIRVIEIPPVPLQYNFIVCLTHDVDFINITDHGLDHSVLGYILRSVFPKSLRNWKSKIAWNKIIKNWKALFSLPFVYLGRMKDIWFDVDRYCEIERDIPATYFFLPYKGNQRKTNGNHQPSARMMKYDIQNYTPLISNLLRQGHEIGLHAIDAWEDDSRGKQEKVTLENLTEQKCVGVRIHWLYFNQESPHLLENAGFGYDSTLGFNDAIGYKAGTSQVFKLPTTKNLLELPLSIMDTALFYQKRMGVTEPKAMKMVKKIIDQYKKFGGVLTINWHTRSLQPERNWDEFYLALLNLLNSEKVWFASAHEAIRWFEIRRQIHFKDISVQAKKIQLNFQSTDYDDLPQFQLRIHTPKGKRQAKKMSNIDKHTYKNIPINRILEAQISFS
jgi:hypothetical protein